ncbi:MAG: methionine biosynthesis protein MetW [Opitutaceae bacterium]
MSKLPPKRTVDMQIIADWIEPGSRVLDLGCGRGVLLEFLVQSKAVRAVGVDTDFTKVTACIRRGLSAYQGDLEVLLKRFPDGFFDHVLCSRTVQELSHPARVIGEALRVGRKLTVGFVNHGYWKNRVSLALHGRRLVNDVYPSEWAGSRPSNPVSVVEFEHFCEESGVGMDRRVYLRGDWKTPCRFLPNLFSGYAIYELGSAAVRPSVG